MTCSRCPVFVDSYDEVDRQFLMRAIVGRDFRQGPERLAGRDIIGMAFRIDDLVGAHHPVELCDGTRYVTYEDVPEERRVFGVLVGEIARLRKKVDCFPA